MATAPEPGEVIDVGEAVRSWRIIRLRNSVAKLGYFIWLKAVRDSHPLR